VGVALLAVALRGRGLPARALAGMVAGLALFVPGLAWMAAFSAPGYAVAALVEAGFLAAAAAAVPPGRGRLLAVAAALVLAEAARSRCPCGSVSMSMESVVSRGAQAAGEISGSWKTRSTPAPGSERPWISRDPRIP